MYSTNEKTEKSEIRELTPEELEINPEKYHIKPEDFVVEIEKTKEETIKIKKKLSYRRVSDGIDNMLFGFVNGYTHTGKVDVEEAVKVFCSSFGIPTSPKLLEKGVNTYIRLSIELNNERRAS